MKAERRRKAIISRLMSENKPVSGSMLAEAFDISRQIIVSDIAILKAQGYDILSTHDGYILQRSQSVERVFKVRHTKDQTEDELRTIVELGGCVANVYVWHKVYGRIEAPLDINSVIHIEKFMEGVRSGKSTELMNITGGYHYHTVRAENKHILECIHSALEEKGYLVPEI